MLVPRHPQRFESVANCWRGAESPSTGAASAAAVRPEAQVLLVDTVGELAALYAAADVAFVGGSLVPVGGHNLLEPAALGVPVITGPLQCQQQGNRAIAAAVGRRRGGRRCGGVGRVNCGDFSPIPRKRRASRRPRDGRSSSGTAAASRGCSSSSSLLAGAAPVAAAAAASR